MKPIFFIVLAGLCVLGGLIGFFIGAMQEKMDFVLRLFRENTQIISIFFTLLLIVTGTIFSLYFIIRFTTLKKLWAKEEERDDNWDYIEDKLASLLTAVSCAIIVTFFLYGCAVYNIRGNLSVIEDGMGIIDKLYDIAFGCSIIFMLIFNFVFFYMQKKIVDFEKIMNPEKKGSLYDFKFSKKWYESFDEAERNQAGIASYKAIIIVSKTCLIMIAALMFLGMVLEITILPLLSVCVLWLVQVIAFGIESRKASKKML
jgi:hypothetical protein